MQPLVNSCLLERNGYIFRPGHLAGLGLRAQVHIRVGKMRAVTHLFYVLYKVLPID